MVVVRGQRKMIERQTRLQAGSSSKLYTAVLSSEIDFAKLGTILV
jgi:hypothetical protein